MSPSNRSRRFRKAVEIVLAAMLALPAFLIAGAHAAAAARNPGLPPTLCVNDVVGQFNGLKHHPEALGFHLGAGAYDPTSGRHYQGIVRIPGEGPPHFVTTRNGNAGDFELPGTDDQPGEVNVVELASRDTNGERIRSNRLVANKDTEDTAPPAEDKVIMSFKTGEGILGSLLFRHLGGMQMWGQIAVIPMDRPYGYNNFTGHIELVDFSDLSDPIHLGGFTLPHKASSVGIAPFGENRLLLITTGNNGSPIYGYEIYRDGKPTQDLRFIPFGPSPYLKKLFEYDAAVKNVGWPTGFQSLQTTNLFKDCATGDIYLMGGYNLAPFENSSRDRLGMWKIDPLTGTLTPASKRQIWCEFDVVDRACNMAAASGFYVSPSGNLMMYAATHDNDGPGYTVEMAEFSSQDGYAQDGAYRPTAVPGGTYKGQPNLPIKVDGTASTPAYAQGRVELYDDVQFRDRSLVVDVPDFGKEDYRHLDRVDGFNDKTSSVRWRLPAACDAVLYKDKDYTGESKTLAGGDGSAHSIENLGRFGDDTTSIKFFGNCDGRIVSYSWDLDADGSVDATGPTPTITAKTGGVHRLALTVCSGFGVCDTKEGVLDASAGTLPKTTPTVTGTAGTNGWYRSAVSVNLSATGTPTPTEIRYSATGAGARSEVVVPGTTATVNVAAQGETVVHFRAVNASGEEADQTVTVKVDTVAPAITVRAPLEGARFVTGSSVTVAVDCTDATSGMATCSPNGQPLDTAGTGPRTLNALATDAAGNTTPKPVGYTLVPAPTTDTQLVFVGHGDGSPGPIQRSNSDGSNLVQLAERGDDPVWSPDGSKVAYTSAPSGVRQVMVAKADGTGTVAVTNSTTWQASSPAWSPDGSRIVYTGTWVEAPNATDRIIHRALFTVPAAGGAPTMVASSDTTNLEDPVYARNGATITFVGGNQIRSIPVAGVAAGELGTVLVGGNFSYQLLSDPAWSPDGTTLTFQLSQSETFTSDVYAWTGAGDPVNLTGTQTAWPATESPSAPFEGGPTFLPDGRLLFVQDGNVYVMAAQRGAQRLLIADLPYNVRNVDARGA